MSQDVLNQSLAPTLAAIPPASAGQERLHSLDAVRAIALLLGVLLHTTMSFIPGPQVWIVADTERSAFLAVLCFTIHMFRMVLFFAIAGLFAHMAFHRIGEWAFVKDRARRIALPLVVGWPILFTLIVIGAVWAALVANGGVMPKNPPPGPTFRPDDFPLTHLWFLWMLMLLYALMLGARRVLDKLDTTNHVRPLLDRAVRGIVNMRFPLILSVPLAIALVTQVKWQMGGGIPTPDKSLYPNLPAWVAFGGAFAFGWLLDRQRALLDVLRARWGWHLAVALVVTMVCLAILGVTKVSSFDTLNGLQVAFALAYGVGVWAWTFALLGIGLRFMSAYSPVRRYLADASYWIYLIHLPIVLALQVLVSRWSWPRPAKLALILGVAMATMLLSYQWFVRYGAIGGVLNGKRRQRLTTSPALDSATAVKVT